jgi:exopolysaccharide biosynthesis polyprenyl glycosylphosphotransferase
MSTRESIASRDTELLRSTPRPTAVPAVVARPASQSGFLRLLAKSRAHKLIYLCGDLLALTLAHMVAFRAVQRLFHVPITGLNPFEYHRFYIPFFAVLLYLFDGYKSPELRRPEQELERSWKAVVISFLGLVLFNFVVFRSEAFSRYLLVCWFLTSYVFLVGVRFAFRAIQERFWRAGLMRRRALLVGSAAGLKEYQQLLSIQRHRGYDVAGAILVPEFGSEPGESEFESSFKIPILGTLERWQDCLADASADLLIVAYPAVAGAGEWVSNLLWRCRQRNVDVQLYSGVLATANLNYEIDEYAGSLRFYAQPRWSLTAQRMLKRASDILLGLIGSTFTLLLTPVIGLIIKLEDGGPIFYRSPYVRSDGENGYYLKFRTMRVDADQVLNRDPEMLKAFLEKHKLTNDPRITRIGRILRKYSLDEFPSFFSILRGDISLVGPRTITQAQRPNYGALLPKLLSVKPGLTGFWQVMGRQTTSYDDKVRLDMFYIDHWSIWLDILIIFKTVWVVIRAEGAY